MKRFWGLMFLVALAGSLCLGASRFQIDALLGGTR
jgi:hypothetical protein